MYSQTKHRSKTPDSFSIPSQRNTVFRENEALEAYNRHDMQSLGQKLSEQIIKALTQSQNICKYIPNPFHSLIFYHS